MRSWPRRCGCAPPRRLGLLLAAGVVFLSAGPGLAYRGSSADGRFRVVVEKNRTRLWDSARATQYVLPGYRQGPHQPDPPQEVITLGGKVETAHFSADGRTLLVAGTCRGYSGVTSPRKPRCITGFIQIWDTATGTLQRALEPYWFGTHDETRILALRIRGQIVLALTAVRWSDCSYGGLELHLQAWTVDLAVNPTSAQRPLWHRKIETRPERSKITGRYTVDLNAEGGVVVAHTVAGRTRSRSFSPPRRTAGKPTQR